MRRIIIPLVVFSALLIAMPATAETIRPGSECKILAEKKVINALTYTCKKATKKQYRQFQHRYVWSKGKLSAKLTTAQSFDGRKFGDGALVGTDIKPGRYWSVNCAGWQHFGDDGLISKSLRGGSQQSMVDVKSGETLLSGCKWYFGEPPAAALLPTGKLSLKTQLLAGKYRPINEFCMSGPTDTRSPDAISASATDAEILVWEQLPANYQLVITGNETWPAYGLTTECGGFKRVD